MKKIFLSALIIFVILSINKYSFAINGTVNTTAVRIREKASTDSGIITVVYKDDEIEILEEDKDWYKIKYKDKVGYIKSEFIKKVENTANTVNTENITTNSTSGNNIDNNTNENNNVSNNPIDIHIGYAKKLENPIKLRIVPNLFASEKIEISAGKEILISAKLGNWYKVTDGDNISGWITASKFNSYENKEQISKTEEKPKIDQPTVSQEKPEEKETEKAPEDKKTDDEKTPETQVGKEPENNTTSDASKTGIINVETARMRKSASTNSDIIDFLDEDDEVTIIGEENEFYKISTKSKKEGYVSKSLVTEKKVTSRSLGDSRQSFADIEENTSIVENDNEQVSEKIDEQSTNNSSKGEEVIEFAKQYLGYSYVLGCSTPETGFDCSGFTKYIFGHFGYNLGRVAADQTSVGDVVERENLQIGDLILFYDEGKTKIGHTGIYIGNGEFIHSANPKRGVVTDNLNTNSYYNTRFVTARRIV